MLSEPSLNVVLDPDDSRAAQQLLRRLHDPGRGWSVAEVNVGDRTLIGLAHIILEALGKNLELPGSDRSGRVAWTQAAIWVNAHQVTDLIVTRAHHLNGGGWQWLAELAAITGARVWIISQVARLNRGQREACQRWGLVAWEWEQFVAIWERKVAIPITSSTEPPGRPFPEVPEADFALFLSCCRASMGLDEFALAERAFAEGAAAAAGGVSDSETICRLLITEGMAASSLDEAICRLRGLQTRLFWEDWLIRLDLPSLRNWLSGRLDPSEAGDVGGSQILSYANPVRAALGALAFYENMAPAQLAEMSVADLSLWREQAEVNILRVACHAQLLLRLIDGASSDEPAFVREERPENPSGAHMIRRRLRTMTEDLGLPLVRGWNPAKREPASTLARRAGFRVSQIHSACDG